MIDTAGLLEFSSDDTRQTLLSRFSDRLFALNSSPDSPLILTLGEVCGDVREMVIEFSADDRLVFAELSVGFSDDDAASDYVDELESQLSKVAKRIELGGATPVRVRTSLISGQVVHVSRWTRGDGAHLHVIIGLVEASPDSELRWQVSLGWISEGDQCALPRDSEVSRLVTIDMGLPDEAEPTMEEILTAIRRIISEDERPPA